jgi:poly(3-hydroxybutyrate) depolymerase
MRLLVALLVCAAACSAEPGFATDPILPEPAGACPQFVSGTQTIGGLQTRVEAGSGGGALLLFWHGTEGTASDVDLFLPPMQREEILAGGGLIVAPQSNGEDRGGFSPNDIWYEGTNGEGGDLAWVDHVVACAVADHGIDPRRIYTTGCSAGGLMAGALALERSRYIAGATPNSGGIVGARRRLQDPTRVPAVFTMHGGATDTVRINFGEASAALDEVITDAGGFAVDCDHQSGHCMADLGLRQAAWTFLKAHPFGTHPSPWADAFPPAVPAYCEAW